MKAEEILRLREFLEEDRIKELVDELLDNTDESLLIQLSENDINVSGYDVYYNESEPFIVDDGEFFGDKISKFLFMNTTNNMRNDVIAVASGAKYVYITFDEDKEIKYYFK